MRTVRYGPGAVSYLDDNHNLVPDVWRAIKELEEAKRPIGQVFRRGPKANLYVIETEAHWLIYVWRPSGEKFLSIIKPIGPSIDEV